mgnify:CR=1 FL=1
MTETRKMPAYMRHIFWLCFLVYSVTYIGRYNYSAAIPAMTLDGFDKGLLGLYGTGFFICYGVGQLVSGVLGDHIPPRHMITVGLIGSGAVNLLMGLVPPGMHWLWCINGLLQSMLWSPIARLLAEWLPLAQCKRAMVNISFTMAVGALAAYGLAALMLLLLSWRWVFLAAALCLIACGAVWAACMSRIETRNAHKRIVYQAGPDQEEAGPAGMPLARVVLLSGLLVVGVALMSDGILKDGVSMWIPTYLTEQFGLGAAASSLAATLLPVLNLLGIYLTDRLNRVVKDEIKTSSILFAVASLALVALAFAQGSMLLSLLLLGLTMMCALGVNMMLLGMLPMYFVRLKKTSTISGLLNTCVHAASSISSYGIAAISTYFGWGVTILTWVGVTALGLVCTLAVRRRFYAFASRIQGTAEETASS